MGTEAQGGQARGRVKAHVTVCPAHNPHISKTLALGSQNTPPNRVLLSSWVALGPSKTQRGESLH